MIHSFKVNVSYYWWEDVGLLEKQFFSHLKLEENCLLLNCWEHMINKFSVAVFSMNKQQELIEIKFHKKLLAARSNLSDLGKSMRFPRRLCRMTREERQGENRGEEFKVWRGGREASEVEAYQKRAMLGESLKKGARVVNSIEIPLACQAQWEDTIPWH